MSGLFTLVHKKEIAVLQASLSSSTTFNVFDDIEQKVTSFLPVRFLAFLLTANIHFYVGRNNNASTSSLKMLIVSNDVCAHFSKPFCRS